MSHLSPPKLKSPSSCNTKGVSIVNFCAISRRMRVAHLARPPSYEISLPEATTVYLAFTSPSFGSARSMHNTYYATVYVCIPGCSIASERAEVSMLFTIAEFHETFYVTLERNYLSRANCRQELVPSFNSIESPRLLTRRRLR